MYFFEVECVFVKGKNTKRKKNSNWLWRHYCLHIAGLGIIGVKCGIFWPALWHYGLLNGPAREIVNHVYDADPKDATQLMLKLRNKHKHMMQSIEITWTVQWGKTEDHGSKGETHKHPIPLKHGSCGIAKPWVYLSSTDAQLLDWESALRKCCRRR